MTFSGTAGAWLAMIGLPVIIGLIFWFVYGKLLIQIFKNIRDFGGAVLKSATSSVFGKLGLGLKNVGNSLGLDSVSAAGDGFSKASTAFSNASNAQLHKTDSKASNLIPAAMKAYGQSSSMKDFISNTSKNKKELDDKAEKELLYRINNGTKLGKKLARNAVSTLGGASQNIKDKFKSMSFGDIKNFIPEMMGGAKAAEMQKHATGSPDGIVPLGTVLKSEGGTLSTSSKAGAVSTDLNSLYKTGIKVTPDMVSPAEIMLKDVAAQHGLKAVIGNDGVWHIKAVGEDQIKEMKVALSEVGRALEVDKMKSEGIEIPKNEAALKPEKVDPAVASTSSLVLGASSDRVVVDSVREKLGANGLVDGTDYEIHDLDGKAHLRGLTKSVDELDTMLINTPVEMSSIKSNSIVDIDGRVRAHIKDTVGTDTPVLLNRDYVVNGDLISFVSDTGMSAANDMGISLDDVSVVGTVDCAISGASNLNASRQVLNDIGVEFSVTPDGLLEIDNDGYKRVEAHNAEVLNTTYTEGAATVTVERNGETVELNELGHALSLPKLRKVKEYLKSYDIPREAVRYSNGKFSYLPDYQPFVEGAIRSAEMVSFTQHAKEMTATTNSDTDTVELLNKLGVKYAENADGTLLIGKDDYRTVRDYNKSVIDTNFDTFTRQINMTSGGQQIFGKELTTQLSHAKLFNLAQKLYDKGYSKESVYIDGNGKLVYDDAASGDVNKALVDAHTITYKSSSLDVKDLANKGFINDANIVETNDGAVYATGETLNDLATGKFNTEDSVVCFEKASLVTLLPDTYTDESKYVLTSRKIDYIEERDGSLIFGLSDLDSTDIKNLIEEIVSAGLYECVEIHVSKTAVDSDRFSLFKDEFRRLFVDIASITTADRIVVFPDCEREYERVAGLIETDLHDIVSDLHFDSILGVTSKIKGKVYDLAQTKVLGTELTENEVLVTSTLDADVILSQIDTSECLSSPLYMVKLDDSEYYVNMSPLQYTNCLNAGLLTDLKGLYNRQSEQLIIDGLTFNEHFNNSEADLLKWITVANAVSLPQMVYDGANIPELVKQLQSFIDAGEVYLNGNSLILLSYSSRLKFKELQTKLYKEVVNRSIEAGNKYVKQYAENSESTKEVLGKPNRPRVCDMVSIELDAELCINLDYIEAVISNIESSGIFRKYGVVSSNIYYKDACVIVESDEGTRKLLEDLLCDPEITQALLSCTILYKSKYENFIINYVCDQDNVVERSGYKVDTTVEEVPPSTLVKALRIYVGSDGMTYRVNPITGVPEIVHPKFTEGTCDLTATLFKNSISLTDERGIDRELFIRYADEEERTKVVQSAKVMFYLNISDYMFDSDIEKLGIDYKNEYDIDAVCDKVADYTKIGVQDVINNELLGKIAGILRARSGFETLRYLGIDTPEKARKFVEHVTSEDLLGSMTESDSYLEALRLLSEYSLNIHRKGGTANRFMRTSKVSDAHGDSSVSDS